MASAPASDLAQFIWETRYRDPDARPAETSLEGTWGRVARGIAAVERDSALWERRFLGVLEGHRFLPAGRILAGAGTGRRMTLFNCFVMGPVVDSMDGIFESLKEAAITMQQGGGVGYDFSTLRPHGSGAKTAGTVASGPVAFMRVWDAACETIRSTSARRGAMMGTLACDHPDVETFIDAKRDPRALPHFNLSVLVTDAFMRALHAGDDWPLVFPGNGELRKVVRARELWQRLCRAAHETAEPGVLFIDRINAANNLGYCERIRATNPCGEEPLPPYGACNLGSINLTAFVSKPFTQESGWDRQGLAETARVAVRFLDDVTDASSFPLEKQRDQARRTRRIGLGVTGLADALVMRALRYDSPEARQAAAEAMSVIRDAAYGASTELAAEKGAFPAFEADAYCDRPFIRELPTPVQSAVRRAGIRNSHLTAIAPAGTISLLAHNVSSGIEPCFGADTVRHVRAPDGSQRTFVTPGYACAAWRARHGDDGSLPSCFVEGTRVPAGDHLLMQAALQPFVDSGISKTVALGCDVHVQAVDEILQRAYDLGLKGCTVYRAGTRPAVVEPGLRTACRP